MSGGVRTAAATRRTAGDAVGENTSTKTTANQMIVKRSAAWSSVVL